MKDLKTCLKGLRRILRPVLGRDLVMVLIGGVRIASSLAFVWICKRLVDIVTGSCEGALMPAVWTMLVIMLVQLFCNIASSYWGSLNTVKTQNDLRLGYFSHVLNTRWIGRETFKSGDTVNRIEEDVRVITELVCSRIPEVVITLIQLVASSVYLLTMAPSLLWVLVILMAAAVFGSKMYFGKIRKLTALIRSEDSDVQQYIQENLQNRVLVLTLFGTGNVVSRLSSLQALLKKNTITRMNYNAVARGFMNLGFMGGYAAAFLWGVFGIKSGAVSFGMMTAFLQLVGQVQRPIAELGREVPAFIKALTSVERLMELEDLPLERYHGDFQFNGAPGIRLSSVSFAFPGSGTDVIKGFSHDFKPGTLSVLAGPTGSGKTTITRLMLGLLRPGSGSVELYSEDGTSHTADVDTRCNFTYVPQGNSLLSGTIRGNMLLACPDATEEQMKDALKLAAAEFVLDLPEGLDTVCGENGTGLSEGQSQRIAIARALLHPGGIIILDEATSALDQETEERLLDNIHTYMAGSRTIVFISHRPAATRIADDVVTL